jgi:serine phosphatase RsbU (regulator of sigma subunit)
VNAVPSRKLRELLLRFGLLYAGGALLVLFWTTLESIFIKRLPLSSIVGFPLKVTTTILAVMIVFMEVYTYLRLKSPWRGVPGGTSNGMEEEDRICRSLLRIPSELFWIILAFGGVFLPVFHITHYVLVSKLSLFHVDRYHWLSFMKSFMFEQTIVLSVGILYFIVSRRLLRPLLVRLSNVTGAHLRDRSFLMILTVTFAGLLFVSILTVLWYVINVRLRGEAIELHVLLSLTTFNALFAVTVFVLLAYEFRRELELMIRSIRALFKGNGERSYAKMPVLSNDEVGSLAVAFNRLQHRISREYEELEQDLKLARNLQQQLLPAALHEIGPYRVAAMSEPRKEVGSGFYEVLRLPDERFAVVVGDLAGAGLPAALKMSAALLLLRAEIRQGGTAGGMLTRLNRVLAGALSQETVISLGLAIVDTKRGAVSYAGAGYVYAVLGHGGRTERFAADAIPLGLFEHTVYDDVEKPYGSGDRLTIYTRTVERLMEDLSSGQDSIGLPERRLLCLDEQKPLHEQLADGLGRFRSTAPEEDFTLLICCA